MSIDCVSASSEFLTTASHAVPSNSAAVTVSAWVYPKAINTTQAAYRWWPVGNGGILLRGESDELEVFCFTDEQFGGEVNLTLSANQWQHIAVRFVADSLMVGYLDGVAGSTTYTPTGGNIFTGSAVTTVGKNNAFYANWKFADIALWTTDLGATAISDIFNKKLRATWFPTNRVQYWRLDVPGDDVFHACVNGDEGMQDKDGSTPLILGTAPDWDTSNPALIDPMASVYSSPAIMNFAPQAILGY